MSQEPSADAVIAADKIESLDVFTSDMWTERRLLTPHARSVIALALDAFAAQAVVAHAREPDEAMIETIARAIYEGHWGPVSDAVWPDLWEREKACTYLEKQARAVLAAIGPGRSDRDAVIEECAQWHDKQREAWLDQERNAQRLSQGGDEAEAQEYRQQHERYAAYAIIHRQSAEELRRGKSPPRSLQPRPCQNH